MASNADVSDLYFRQLKVGEMENFIYLIGSHKTKQCLVVDPAWDTDYLIDVAGRDGMKITGALVTHYHPDHCGGSFIGLDVPGGVAELVGKADAKIHVNKVEADGLIDVTGVSKSDLVAHDSGDLLDVGDVRVRFVHTPGHTPGSQCFYVENRLISGDTLFVGGCGRVDLPGGDGAELRKTLQERLASLDDGVILCPGHDYGPSPTSTLGRERRTNYGFRQSLHDLLGLIDGD
jgi:glyoxylase-like metal-dependent hydrolase (beta-lactamase superfamily II)